MTSSQLVQAYKVFADSEYPQVHLAIEETVLSVLQDMQLGASIELLSFLGKMRIGSKNLLRSLLEKFD